MRISDWSSDVCSSDLAAMAVVMLGFMFAMYPSKRANAGIFAGGAAGRGDLYEIEASELAVDRSDSPLFARSPTRCSPTMKMPSRFKIGRASCRGRACQYV